MATYLVQTYYGASPDPGPQASSHWQHHARLADVQTDPTGTVRALKGTGFGTLRWATPFHALLDKTSIALHRSRLRLPGLGNAYGRMKRVCRRMGLHPTFDAFRQACTFALIESKRSGPPPREILLIGDGYGVLAGIMKESWPAAHITLVDLGRTLLFQAHHLERAFPGFEHVLGPAGSAFGYCPAEERDRLAGATFGLAVNVASMQEMTPAVIADYFRFLRTHMTRDNLFYCCNRVSKTLPGGETVQFFDYPWSEQDQHVVDAPCPWHEWFLQLGRTARRPRVLGLPIPFVHSYDGPVHHRLTRLALS